MCDGSESGCVLCICCFGWMVEIVFGRRRGEGLLGEEEEAIV